jgi:hypothetical protein
MRYTEFHFKNFKGIEKMTLKLSGPITTLIGLNESGKTTVLEAIFCFSYGAEDLEAINPEMASLRVPDQWIPISKRANFNDTIELCAVVALSRADKGALKTHMRDEYGLALTELPDSIKITEKHVFENSRFINTNYVWALTLKGTKGGQRKPRKFGGSSGTSPEWQGAVNFLKTQLPRIWYFPNFLFELPERFSLADQEPAAGDEEHDRSRFYRSTFEQILSQIGEDANLQTHVVDRLESSERADQRSLKAVLLGMSRVITTTIFEGWDRIFGRRPAAQEVELEVGTEEGDPYLELKIKGSDGYYDLSERSLGFRWFFMFLLMTSFHGHEEKDGPRVLFLLDEPASNLHSTAQAELLKSFHTLVEKYDLVYTTHSHHLIDVHWLDAAYVVKNAALGSLDIADYLTQRIGANTAISATLYRQFVSEHPDQTSYFQPVLDLLDYRPSALEPVPDVVLVEGKSDFYLMRYAREVLGLGADVNLVPGGGAGALGPLIRLYVGWGKSFVILLDGDAEGKTQKERYESEFGPVIDGRCLLLSDLCGDPSIQVGEQLLEEEDREMVIAAIFSNEKAPKPKKALRQAILELYARRDALELTSTSKERIHEVLNQLQSALAAQE